MEKWVIKNKKGDFEKLSRELNILPVTAKLLCNRGISLKEDAEKFLHPRYEDMFSPFEMHGMEEACTIIKQSVAGNEKIRIVGDYDVDGVTSTFILESGLRELGANVSSRIPDRVKDGYGINESIIREAKQDGISLIVTCDNGIRAVHEIALAYDLGIKVIVTDHHDIPETVPHAEVILNPKYAKCRDPYTELCGAAVALKLIEALNCKEGEKHSFETVRKYIEIAATATVCDVVELQGENRCIVKLGLEKFNLDGLPGAPVNTGLRELMNASGVRPEEIDTFRLGFVIGPCINAGGRLDTALQGLKLLNGDTGLAAEQAKTLMDLNEERKHLTKLAEEEAVSEIEKSGTLDKVLVLLLRECHESIAGIVAGRVRERYDRPAIVLTYGESMVKGSARSIEEYNITEELEKCSDLLTHFGGHAMAAGMSLDEKNVPELRRRLNENCSLTEDRFFKKVGIDVVMPARYANEMLCSEIAMLAPFGNGNPEPLFAEKNAEVCDARPIGKESRFVKLKLKGEAGDVREFVYFGDKAAFEKSIENCYGADAPGNMYRGRPLGIRLSVTYFPSINEYNGYRSVQLKLKNYLI